MKEYIVAIKEVAIGFKATDLREEVIRCKNCKWFGNTGCAVTIVDDSDKPKESDFCSWAERKEE